MSIALRERAPVAACLEGPLGEATLAIPRELNWFWKPLEQQVLDNFDRTEYVIQIGGCGIAVVMHDCSMVTMPSDNALFRGENGVNKEFRAILDFQENFGVAGYPFSFKRVAVGFAANGSMHLRTVDIRHAITDNNPSILRTRFELDNGRLMRAKQEVEPNTYFPNNGNHKQGFAFSFMKDKDQDRISGYYTIYGITSEKGQVIQTRKLGAAATVECLGKIVKFQPALPR